MAPWLVESFSAETILYLILANWVPCGECAAHKAGNWFSQNAPLAWRSFDSSTRGYQIFSAWMPYWIHGNGFASLLFAKGIFLRLAKIEAFLSRVIPVAKGTALYNFTTSLASLHWQHSTKPWSGKCNIRQWTSLNTAWADTTRSTHTHIHTINSPTALLAVSRHMIPWARQSFLCCSLLPARQTSTIEGG